jgi:hypothetical protein
MTVPPRAMCPAVGCALCADRAQARALANRGARDWTAEEVRGWFERVSGGEPGRNGLKVASRTDRAVFRFLLPRVLELLAAGALPADATTVAVFAQFEPGRLAPGGTSPDAIMPRFAGLLLDRALQDPDWPVDLIPRCGFWPVAAGRCRVLCSRRRMTPIFRQALRARGPGRTGANRRFPGTWPAGAVSVLRSTFVTPLLVERMMNYAMAEGTSACETDDAMRAADLLLRNL